MREVLADYVGLLMPLIRMLICRVHDFVPKPQREMRPIILAFSDSLVPG